MVQEFFMQNTALHLASIENHPGVISMLLSHNCQIIPNKSGMYSVDCAIQRKHDEATLALVTHENRHISHANSLVLQKK